jgi:hypothetical protein
LRVVTYMLSQVLIYIEHLGGKCSRGASFWGILRVVEWRFTGARTTGLKAEVELRKWCTSDKRKWPCQPALIDLKLDLLAGTSINDIKRRYNQDDRRRGLTLVHYSCKREQLFCCCCVLADSWDALGGVSGVTRPLRLT